jgi:hypothetical protein
VTYPEIYQMQVRAIAEAASDMVKAGKKLIPEIMIPLVAVDKELELLRDLTEKEVKAVQKERGVQFEYQIGTMIELPRAAVTAPRGRSLWRERAHSPAAHAPRAGRRRRGLTRTIAAGRGPLGESPGEPP